MLNKIWVEVEKLLGEFFAASVLTRAKSGVDGAAASTEHNTLVSRVAVLFTNAETAAVSTAEDAIAAIKHVASRGYSHEAAVAIVEEHGPAKILAGKSAVETITAEEVGSIDDVLNGGKLPSAADLDAVAKEAAVATATATAAVPAPEQASPEPNAEANQVAPPMVEPPPLTIDQVRAADSPAPIAEVVPVSAENPAEVTPSADANQAGS